MQKEHNRRPLPGNTESPAQWITIDTFHGIQPLSQQSQNKASCCSLCFTAIESKRMDCDLVMILGVLVLVDEKGCC